MSELANPHDRFFKQAFARPELAADFLRHYLPEPVAALLDPDPATLRLRPGSFVDPDLRQHFSDLLFQARLAEGGEAYVYVLLEHKSRPDALVAFQLLRYLVRIWEQDQRASGANRLAPVIPVVVYHGRERWAVAPGFGALFDGPEALRAYWPEFGYELADLSAQAAVELRGALVTRAVLGLLRAIQSAGLTEELPATLMLLGGLEDVSLLAEHLTAMLEYVAAARPEMTESELGQAVSAAFQDKGGGVMALVYENWIERGRQEGLQEGRQEGRQEGLQEGRQEGRQEGLQKGLQEGRQEGRQEGLRQGLLEGIDLALELKFGQAGLLLMPEIRAIGDISTLQAVQAAIRDAGSVEAVRRVVHEPPVP
jgi:predicted transposase/invertase (TIGR01784 family)